MRIKFLLIIFTVFSSILFSCNNVKDDAKWVESLPKPWELTENEVSGILPQFYNRFPNFEDRLGAIVNWKIGTPYEIFKLGEEKLPDLDPLFRLDVSDCTVHVLTSLALAQSRSWTEARDNMKIIHYKQDTTGIHEPIFNSRWHFTSERILSNPYTVNITDSIIDSSKLEKVALILNRKENGDELLNLNWTKKVNLFFIPSKFVNEELLQKLPNICGIAFVKKSYIKNGLAIAHEGILIDQNYLVHASATANKTVKVNLLEYYHDENSKFDGIMLYKFVPISNLF